MFYEFIFNIWTQVSSYFKNIIFRGTSPVSENVNYINGLKC